MDRLEFLTYATNDSWIRDYGPIFVVRDDPSGTRAQLALDWKFNSWGDKYGPYDLDDVIPRRLAAQFGFECLEVPLVMEGGSIDVNGAGSLLTTESCLLNPNRNPGLGRQEIEEYLRVFLGVSNILWLGEGIAGDDTDGHVDDLARFVSRDTIVTVIEDDPSDDNYGHWRKTLNGCARCAIRTASHSKSRPCRCRQRFTTRASVCRRLTPTSISPTAP